MLLSRHSHSYGFRLRKVLSLAEARNFEAFVEGEILSSDALVQEWYREHEGQHCIGMLAERHCD